MVSLIEQLNGCDKSVFCGDAGNRTRVQMSFSSESTQCILFDV